jgi:mannose-6-phosphate isomerase
VTDRAGAAPRHALPLGPNQFPRPYRGGRRIAEFRGSPAPEREDLPEDWIASTVRAADAPAGTESGLSRLPDGELLAAAVAADPEGWLGHEHVQAFGVDPAVLVKLLDTGERLFVHVHPTRELAARELGSKYGKTEAWHVLHAEPDARVWAGFTADMDADRLAGLVRRQDVSGMLAALAQWPVRAGDTLLVSAGTPHAIGPGVLLVEVQEPTDFSLLLEWEGRAVPGPPAALAGLDLPSVLADVDRSAWTPARHAGLSSGGGDELLPDAADPLFRLTRLRAGAPALTAGFGVVVVTGGEGELLTGAGCRTPVRRGATCVVAAAAGGVAATGTVSAVVARPAFPRLSDA